jgi:hypothetical protein
MDSGSDDDSDCEASKHARIQTKRCSWCHRTKAASEFLTNPITGKLRGYCIPCQPKAAKKASKWQKKNPKKANASTGKWAAANKEKVYTKNKVYKSNNRKLCAKRERDKYHNDEFFRLKVCLRARLRHFLKKNKIAKATETMALVGCSAEDLSEHLKRQLPEGADLKQFQVDHIFPLAKYTKEEISNMTHFSNLQPLAAKKNNSKGSKMPRLAEAMKVDRERWPKCVQLNDIKE